MATKKAKLTNKQAVFVDHYLRGWNATAAAKAAGYSDATAYSIGWQNLRKVEIKAAIDARLKEHAMPADEVLARLTAQARGSQSPFFRVTDEGNIEFDFGAPDAADHMHLIKRIHTKRKRLMEGRGDDAEEWEHEWVEVELYDAQAALVQLGKHHRLFAEGETRNELVVVGLDEMLERAYGEKAKHGRNRKG